MIKKITDNILFGDTIMFDEVFLTVEYINDFDLIDTKLYDTDTFKVSEPKRNILHDCNIYPRSVRKLIFSKKNGNGIVIGEKVLREGFYNPGCRSSGFNYEDYEQAYLEVSRQYSFWVVATSMNTTTLIPKKLN